MSCRQCASKGLNNSASRPKPTEFSNKNLNPQSDVAYMPQNRIKK